MLSFQNNIQIEEFNFLCDTFYTSIKNEKEFEATESFRFFKSKSHFNEEPDIHKSNEPESPSNPIQSPSVSDSTIHNVSVLQGKMKVINCVCYLSYCNENYCFKYKLGDADSTTTSSSPTDLTAISSIDRNMTAKTFHSRFSFH